MHSEDIYALDCCINRAIDEWLKGGCSNHLNVSNKTRRQLVDELIDVLTDEPYGKGSTRYKKDEKKEQIRKYHRTLKAI